VLEKIDVPHCLKTLHGLEYDKLLKFGYSLNQKLSFSSSALNDGEISITKIL
jgi:hypothetical protein